jgi:hypothetical protein
MHSSEKAGRTMARYFSDLDDGKTKYIDSVGTELADIAMVPAEAIGFLTATAKDVRDDADRTLVVRVRNERGQIIFTTTLKLQSDWLEAGLVARLPDLPRSSPCRILSGK